MVKKIEISINSLLKKNVWFLLQAIPLYVGVITLSQTPMTVYERLWLNPDQAVHRTYCVLRWVS